MDIYTQSVNKKYENPLPSSPIDFQNQEKSNNEHKSKTISYFELFRYATKLELLLIFVGLMLAVLASVFVPYSIVIYGEFTSLLIDRTVGVGTSSQTLILALFGGGATLTNASVEENRQAIVDDSIAFGWGSLVGAILLLVLIASSIDILNRVALNQIGRIRKLFLKSILRQDMSWYDTSSDGNFANKMTDDLEKMKEGIGEKICLFTFLIMTFVMGIVASFVYGWKLTLVVVTCCPFIMISTSLVAKIQSSLAAKELKAYSVAGGVAEEVFSSIRTVLAFSGERKEMKRFANLLKPAEQTGFKKGLYSGIGGGLMWFIIYCCYAIAMWYGVKLILEDRAADTRHYTPGVLVIVLFGTIMGAQNLGYSAPHVEAFGTAMGAVQNVFSIIDRKSKIDPLSDTGNRPAILTGKIHFENIFFRYPARPDVEILRGLTLDIEAGQTVAFVGASGCGKSTALQLVQRFYDPLAGCVNLDGVDLRTLNVSWLRSQIGVVGQEPVLFATTIAENIRYGNPTATLEDIECAAKMANCHDFILQLPNGYNTFVGASGSQMSGGQKQRIAIARALVRNPKILLLDEPTSALDTTSEKRVQLALDVASKGRTTLVVSHRLSTVTNADKIVFIKDGMVAEQGTHHELMSKGGLYSQLVQINKCKEATINSSNSKLQLKQKSIDYEFESDSEKCENKHFDTEKAENIVSHNQKNKKIAEKYNVSFRKLITLNSPEWYYILAGCIAAMLHGATFPLFAVVFGDFFGVMQSDNANYIQSSANFFSYMFLVIGLIAGLGTLTQIYMFNKAGVKMTSRLRKTAFKAIISQNVAYFDDNENNSVGALCARLSGDCSNVQGATGTRIGVIVQAISTLVVGMIIGFLYSWKLTLVTLITVPLMCLAIIFESRYMAFSVHAEKTAIEKASQVAVEAITNIRTVASLGQEIAVLSRFDEEINILNAACHKKIRFRGTVFGLGQAANSLAYGLSLFYGGLLVATEGVPYQDVIKCSEALIYGSWMLGQALAYTPNVSGAIISAGRLLKLFESTPSEYTPQNKPFNKAEKSEGDIIYKNVDFQYSTRKGTPTLQGLNVNIKSGTTVALVGPSGSGKSTCVQLLLRYYDPIAGSVNLSGTPTTEFSIDTLRSKLGLVSQEPVLFDRTIAENIAYGNNFRDEIPMSEIIEAAKSSNIHNFITSLPKGYETMLGSKGTQLSGGQKQRIAIARALMRNPKILILDEATSALDLESEKIVQEALDAARSGRTCITIAHRLTTIRDADLICVLKNGMVVEQGNHDELMTQSGIYAELYMLQQVDK